MEMKKINSGRLRAIGYDARARILQVQLDDGSTLQYGGIGDDAWRRLSGSGAAWSFYRDNIEEEFTAKRVSGNGHMEVATPHNEARHVRSTLLNPIPMLSPQPSDGTTSHSTRLSKDDSQVAGYPASGREKQLFIPAGEEAKESPREFQVTAPAGNDLLDDLFGKPE